MSKKRNVRREFPHVSEFLETALFRRRREMKISQTTLAARVGLSRNCIQQMECREHLPLPSTISRLIRGLEFSGEETARFWAGIDAAYAQDPALQGDQTKTHEVI